ncbi:MAG: glutathione S-transferase [Gammaproteobacteria bacterium]|nr:glutathione S-transferase [Gammaproteobacteria bacterium]
MKLYDMELSGNCYKVRLLCAMLGLDYERIPISLKDGEAETEEFLQLNPRAQIPVLEDDGLVIWDSIAILSYLCRKQDSNLLPTAAEPLARVMQWLAVSENEILYGLARARAINKFGRPFHRNSTRVVAIDALKLIDGHLQDREWLATDQLSIADIACYPYVALAHEGDIDISRYPAIQAWIGRIRQQPGYIDMPGMDNTPLI